ncbi:serine hydrolase [Paenibacillus sp. L3-i20]|uniref:serine hydrolase domain-containing protein n=1 Tax=Paenibacillus sp. L3-i20 TaxID=2905833 RepID=UPI001EDCB264|nr:serine hydrolase domain-containing protein [Paenibacillus sp. L3-i20]GKU79157.1 serine hydrolase [Paenibacillus sp. L3-i20]
MNEVITNWRIIEGPLDAAPEDVGMDSTQLNKLDKHFENLFIQEQIQGAGYLVSRHGKIVAARTMGTLNGVKNEGELQPDSIRKLSSITKMFTAISIVKLIEDGKLFIDQPVATIIKEFDNPTHQTISIFHVLTHTSGIMPVSGYYNEPYPREWWGARGTDGWIRKILQGTLICQPGEAYNYSTVGFAILGEIISRISGMSYEDFVTEHIINPLHLERTFFNVPEYLHSEVLTVDQYDIDSLSRTYPEGEERPPKSDSGLYSTMYDLWKVGQMLLNGGVLEGQRVLGRKSVELLTKRHLFNVPAYHWGGKIKDKGHALGIDLSIDHLSFESIGTYQMEGAGRSGIFVDPVEDMVVIMFVPSIYSWVPLSILGTKQIIWSSLK